MVSSMHSFSAIFVFLTLLSSSLAANLPAYPLVCKTFSVAVFCRRLTLNRLCEIHIYLVSADFEVFTGYTTEHR